MTMKIKGSKPDTGRREVKKSFELSQITVDTEGEFSALVSVFGVVDSYGEVIEPGAFVESLERFGENPIPILWNHQWGDLLSHLGGASAEETDEGLVIHAKLDLENASSRQVYKMLKDGRLREFSIGGFEDWEDVRVEERPDGDYAWFVSKFHLVEVSVVLRGANAETQLLDIKSWGERAKDEPDADPDEAPVPAGDDPPDTPLPASADAEVPAPQGAEIEASDTASGASSVERHKAAALLTIAALAEERDDMNLEQKLKELRAEADRLRLKGVDLTAEDVERVPALQAEIADVEGKIVARKSAEEALKSFGSQPAPKREMTEQGEELVTGSLGERFVKSAGMEAFRRDNPNGPGEGGTIAIKSAVVGSKRAALKADPAPLNRPANGNLAPVRLPGIEDVTYRRPHTLLDLITQGTTEASWLQYRQLIGVTNNAAVVAEAVTTTGTTAATGLKPLSTLTTVTADAKDFTYADGIEATNQELADDGALAALIDGVLTENVRTVIEQKLLNGSGTNGQPTGILNTTGVLQQDFVTDMVTSLRKAKTLLAQTSFTFSPTVLLNPEDDEEFDLLKDANERFYGGGPFGTGPGTIWAMPRAISALLPVGTALVGDFSQVQLLIREALSIQAFNQHKDYAQRNLVYFRAELRALQLFRQPAKLALVDLTGV